MQSRLQSLVDIGLAINASQDLTIILERVVGPIRDLMQVDHASIILWDEQSTSFRRGASTNTKQISSRVRRHNGASRWIIDNAKPLYVDIHNDPFDPNPIIAKHQIKSYLGMPIIHGGKALGVLYALSQNHRYFTTEEEELLASVAAMTALAVQRAQLLASLQAANAFKSALLHLTAHDLREHLEEVHEQLASLHADLELSGLPPASQTLSMEQHLNQSLETLVLMQKYEQATNANPDRVVCDLNILVTTAASMMMSQAQAKAQQVSLHLSPELRLVHVDPALVQEAILQLGAAAIYHSHEGSHINVRVEAGEEGHGIAILPDDQLATQQLLEQIVEPLIRPQVRPSSWALSIVRVIAEKHRGRLEESTDEQAGVKLVFPAYEAR